MDMPRSSGRVVTAAPAEHTDFRLVRNRKSSTATEGVLLFDLTQVFTLEEPWRDNQPNVSCIPEGSYRCIIAWSNRFQRLMPRLLDVPGRSGILIHPGNTLKDTSGCILVGNLSVAGALHESQLAFAKFWEWLGQASRSGNVVVHISHEPDWSA